MCGRFAVTTDPALLAERIDAVDETVGDGAPRYNVAPTTDITVLVRRHATLGDAPRRRLRTMRWGLVPPWAKADGSGRPAAGGPLLINARAEKVGTSPAFRAAAQRTRCLVPMAGWYEWQAVGDSRVRGAAKAPHYLHAADGAPLFMAGLWSVWRPRGADAAPVLSATIITTDAAGPVADIHDRMPLTVGPDDVDRWLDPDLGLDEGLLRGHGELDRIAVRRVSTLVNRVANDGPELLEAVDAHGPQTLL